MVVNSFITRLKNIGLSEYEAKAYLALLKRSPATAYEIARSAGLPTSKIYQIIDKLQARGLIQTVMEGKKKRHIPLKPQEFIKNERRRAQAALDALEEDLAEMQTESQVSYVWNITDYRFLIEKIRQAIGESRQELLLSLWDKELEHCAGEILRAAKRGVRVAAVIFGGMNIDGVMAFHHPIEDTLYHERGGRGVTVVADSGEAITGTVLDESRVEGAWSTSRGFVLMAEEYIKHDIYIMKIVRRFDGLLIGRFGDNYRLLRDVFSDREVHHEKP